MRERKISTRETLRTPRFQLTGVPAGTPCRYELRGIDGTLLYEYAAALPPSGELLIPSPLQPLKLGKYTEDLTVDIDGAVSVLYCARLSVVKECAAQPTAQTYKVELAHGTVQLRLDQVVYHVVEPDKLEFGINDNGELTLEI